MTRNAHLHRILFHAMFTLAVLARLVVTPVPALALGSGEAGLPPFAEFSKTVQNDEAGMLRGVYVANVLALPVVQQPAGSPGYVSTADEEITQFGMASRFGNVGLLAHNYLSGRLFDELGAGQEVRLVYGDGRVETFVIVEILEYQALQPNSQYSAFRDLSSDEKLTAEEVFRNVYAGDRHVTFQTCIAKAGSASWGRLFVIAVPKPEPSLRTLFMER